MKAILFSQVILAAVLAATVAVASALGVARVVARQARHDSHQQPTPERWFEPPPVSTPELLTQGRKLFLNNCAHCHGIDARGDEGPDLHDIQVSDRYLARTITGGIKGEMPSFAKKLGPPEVGALTAYLRSL